MNNIIASLFLDIGAVRFDATRPYTYTSGLRSPIYCDLRLIMSYPREREVVIRELIRSIGDNVGLSKVDVISGTATAGVPFASWIADRLHLPMIYVRSSAKKHGLGNQIEGSFGKKDNVLVVEDIVSSGKSSIGNIESVQEQGATVVGAVAMASYEMSTSVEAFGKAGVSLYYLSPMQAVILEALDRGVLDHKEVSIINDWLDDPAGWYERQGYDDK